MLTPEQRGQIESAIRNCEQKTSGEIVVAHLARSSFYATPRLLLAGLFAAAIATALLVLTPAVPSVLVIASQAPIAALVYLVLGIAPLHRAIAGTSAMEDAVDSRAAQIFTTRGIHATRDRTGVLILVSRLERRVVIKADIAIDNELGGSEAWRRYVATITDAIKRGEPAAGIVHVIDTIGAALADKFPRRADDTNELPDTVVDS